MNATREDNRLALIEDSKAFGIGCAVGAVLQFLFCVVAIDLINFSALKQVSITILFCLISYKFGIYRLYLNFRSAE